MQRMDKLRRSLRDSFRKKREAPESSKPHQWQADEEAVRSGNCSFHVKYLGCVEVFESRGMNVCEEAMKVLRVSSSMFKGSRRRPVKALLHVSGDGLRVVEDDTKGLIVDQTIEKVSFCAPDRNHERGFSYICRDGTTRRWMCHGFLASKDSGERLSHAVGCAFASCLERKQKREKECGVTMSYDSKTSTFTRSGSFRVPSMTDALSTKSTSPPPVDSFGNPIKPANPHAIERPHAPVKMLERQGSFRGFTHLASQSPFKRQLSLRLDDLPSNLLRSQQASAEMNPNSNASSSINSAANSSPAPPPRTQRGRLQSLPSNSLAGNPIPESNGGSLIKIDSRDLSEYCQEFTHQLSLLAANHDDIKKPSPTSKTAQFPTKFSNTVPWEEDSASTSTYPSNLSSVIGKSTVTNKNNFVSSSSTTSKTDNWNDFNTKPGSIFPTNKLSNTSSSSPNKIINTGKRNGASFEAMTSNPSSFRSSTHPSSDLTNKSFHSSKLDSNLPASTISNTPLSIVETETSSSGTIPGTSLVMSHQRPPLVSAMSVQQPGSSHPPRLGYRAGGPGRSQSLGADPFDADWAAPVARTGQTPTNPFARHQTFQVSM